MVTTRRRRSRGVLRYPSKNRVMQITKLAQWNRLHHRGRSQLIFVMFTFGFMNNRRQLETAMAELAVHSDYQDVLFAVVDVEKAEEIAKLEAISAAPTFIAYKSGIVMEKMEGVVSENGVGQVWHMIARNIGKLRMEAEEEEVPQRVPRWRRFAAPFLTVIAFAAGAFAFFVVNQDNSERQKSPKTHNRAKRNKHQDPFSDESSDEEF